MIVNVHMKDGKTFQFTSRGDMMRLLEAEGGKLDEAKAVTGWWRPGSLSAPDLTDQWREMRFLWIRRHAIDYVVDAESEATSADELPAADERSRRAEKWREKQAVTAE
jgi:hypothetical protein